MKKVILFLGLIMGALFLMSNQRGRAAAFGPATGAPGENNGTCGNSGCHSGGSFNPSLDMFLIDADGTSVSEYIPGQTYTVSLKVNHTGLPGGYGFQMVCLDEAEVPINNFINLPADVAAVTKLSRQYVEQTKRLPVDSIPLTWTAPDSESVTFYAVANAVDGTGNPQNDGSASGQFTFAKASESSTLNLITEPISVYPNPVRSTLSIETTATITKVEFIDMAGRSLYTGESLELDLSGFNPGLYLLRLTDAEGAFQMRKVYKI